MGSDAYTGDNEQNRTNGEDSFLTLENMNEQQFPENSEDFFDYLTSNVASYIGEVRRIREQHFADRDCSKFLPLEKTLNDVRVALKNLKQNIDIPDVTLQHHPAVLKIVEEARAQDRKPNASDFGPLLQDSDFLNNLQGLLNNWVREIQKVTLMERDPAAGTTQQEVAFWVNIEKNLHEINNLRECDEVIVTMEALKMGKRFHATVTFDQNTGLKEAIARAVDYNQLMKEFPIHKLLTATDFENTRFALMDIMTALKKIRQTKYPLKKAVSLLQTISSDLSIHLIQIIRPRRLMHVHISELEVISKCQEIFQVWDDETFKLQQIFREMARKQKFEFKHTIRGNYAHKPLEVRLIDLYKFRKQHEQLSNTISRVLRQTSFAFGNFAHIASNSEDQIAKAFEYMKNIDYLDTSKEGTQVWDEAQKYYRDQISKVENELASRLRDQLGGAKNADEMFSIFLRYNALFVRPHIRSAIREFQTALIDRVRADITELQNLFINPEMKKIAMRRMGGIDIPEFAAQVMWSRQIENRLKACMKRVKDVLGEGWANHIDGKQLKHESELFEQKLDTSLLLKEWFDRTTRRNKAPSGKLFIVERQQSDGKSIFCIKVDYPTDSIELGKNVKNLRNLGCRVSFKIMSLSYHAEGTYPYAISLAESIRLYEATNQLVFTRNGVLPLVAGYRKRVHDVLYEGYYLDWDHHQIEAYVVKVAETIGSYQENVEYLVENIDKIEAQMRALDECKFTSESFAQTLSAIQTIVDRLVMNNFANLSQWIAELDNMLEQKLARRTEQALAIWTQTLKQQNDESDDKGEVANNISPQIQRIQIEIRIGSQGIITAVPSFVETQNALMNQFYDWHGCITSQPRITCTRYQPTQKQMSEVRTYKNILARLPHSQILTDALNAIRETMMKLFEYINTWTQHQALGDLQPDALDERLGDDIEKWMRVLNEIKTHRQAIDAPETHYTNIFPFDVDYGKVKSKISVKYDYWQREAMQKQNKILNYLSKNKPTTGKQRLVEAIAILILSEDKFERLKREQDNSKKDRLFLRVNGFRST